MRRENKFTKKMMQIGTTIEVIFGMMLSFQLSLLLVCFAGVYHLILLVVENL
jgi:hypothetical protein